MAKWKSIEAGSRFDRLVVISDEGGTRVRCRCDCGVEVYRVRCKLMAGTVKSCGCAYEGRNRPIPTGKRFGRLVVMSDDGPRSVRVRCDCGAEKAIRRFSLRITGTSSCGCSRTDAEARARARDRFTTHGQSGTALFKIWAGMRKRCENPRCPAFPRYGGRGIKVCERWGSYENFAADVGPRPSPAHSLDRIDNDRGYDPENVRWATDGDQGRNTRRTRFLEHDGARMPLVDWAARLGMNYGTLQDRLDNGWSVERALTEPVNASKRRQK